MSKKGWAIAKVVGIVLATMYVARRISFVDRTLQTGTLEDVYLF